MITGYDPAQKKSTSYRELWSLLVIVIVILFICYLMDDFTLSLDEGIGVYHVTTRVADLDGDGDQDVVVGKARWEAESTSWTGLSLWFNLGDGLFTLDEQERAGPFSADAGDLDGDGDTDLAILDGLYILDFLLKEVDAQGGKIVTYRHFNAISLPVGPGHSDSGGSVVLGDLNGDGALDGFVAGCCYLGTGKDLGMSGLNPSYSFVWINAWNAQGGPPRRLLRINELDGVPIRGAAMGDLDEDGDLDIYAAVGTLISKPEKELADLILLNDGQGNLSISSQKLGDNNSSSVALGDLDGDGDLDALVGTEDGAEVWLNQGGAQGGQVGQFAVSERKIAGKPTSMVFLADFDQDGNQDALIAGIKQAIIWWNDGQGAFSRSDQRFKYSKSDGLAVADFTGDGYPDVFAGSYLDTRFTWVNQGDGTFQAENLP